MNKELISALRTENWAEIRRIAFALPKQEKAQIKKQTHNKDWENIFEEKHLSYKIEYVITYLMMCVCHSVEELLSVEKQLDFTSVKSYHTRIKYPLFFLNSQHSQAFMDFIHTSEGAYMIKGAQLVFEQSPRSFSIEILLALYTEGMLPFNEEIFVKNLYDIEYSRTQEAKAAEVLLQYPELATRVIPHTAKYIDYTLRSNLEWQKVFTLLCKKNYFPDKSFITSFIEVLLNPWKKNVLDMYCRWIEGLVPSEEELLPSQHTLFALLTLDKSSLINFTMKCIAQISPHPAFDFQAFADNFVLCFTVQKIAKSQLIGVEILEKYYQKQAPTNPDYREQLAVLFTVPDAQLQVKVASLLTTYFNQEGLPEVIAPYRDYLKGKAQDLLATLSPSESSAPSDLSDGSASSENSHTSHTSQTARTAGTLTPVSCPLTPEKLLFLLGDCLRERTPQTIDLFFEGFNQLQDDFPADFKEQLAPYLKQLERHWNGIASVPILRWFLQRWTGDKKKLSKEDEEFFLTTLPYLYHKAQHLLENRKKQNRLPFLSTPTHAPFYIEVEVLMDRLLRYETQGENPDLHDLVVACNRLLFKDISAVAKEKAQQLKGAYTPAIQYYIGLTDKVQPTEELLPLWTQITRIKHPDGEFVEFANTSAKDFPTVIKPFMIDFWMKTRKQSDVTFHYLNLEDNWNNNFDMKQKATKYPFPYYNTGNSRRGWSTDILYQCSLNPHYPEAQILRYIASYAKGNESGDIDYMQTSMQVLLENHLPIYHSGWLFVAAALLFEKKPTRDMAAAYILECLESGTNLNLLAQYIGKLLAEQYAPIARFVEFLDIPTRDPKVKAFQKSVVEAYLPLAEKLDKKPTNHKKLTAFND